MGGHSDDRGQCNVYTWWSGELVETLRGPRRPGMADFIDTRNAFANNAVVTAEQFRSLPLPSKKIRGEKRRERRGRRVNALMIDCIG